MNEWFNQIHAVRQSEQRAYVEENDERITWVTELSEGGIETYHTEYRSRKKLGVSKTPVSKDEMRAFFDELYEFIRSAEIGCDITDDCLHKITFYYNPYHKEIFEGDVIKDNDSLDARIGTFVSKHRKNP